MKESNCIITNVVVNGDEAGVNLLGLIEDYYKMGYEFRGFMPGTSETLGRNPETIAQAIFQKPVKPVKPVK